MRASIHRDLRQQYLIFDRGMEGLKSFVIFSGRFDRLIVWFLQVRPLVLVGTATNAIKFDLEVGRGRHRDVDGS